MLYYNNWMEPGSSGFELEFDEKSNLELYHDKLTITNFDGEKIVDLTGKCGHPSWPSTIQIDQSSIHIIFSSDDNKSEWGYSYSIRPSYKEGIGAYLPDAQSGFIYFNHEKLII
jgi:hypothetical protein